MVQTHSLMKKVMINYLLKMAMEVTRSSPEERDEIIKELKKFKSVKEQSH